VLIGTAVVGATTMIFSIIMLLTKGTHGKRRPSFSVVCAVRAGANHGRSDDLLVHRRITQAVTTGAYPRGGVHQSKYQARGVEKASVEDSKKVVEICTKYAQKGMLNIFIAVFFATLAFSFLEPFFFIGYLISIAIFGLYQAIFMANAGGAWITRRKIVEVELKQKGTPLHDATVIGDTVGDPFKDTSSVALNPVIKFTTLFGLLAVELAVRLTAQTGGMLTHLFSAAFFAVSFVFVYRSFYSSAFGIPTRFRVAHTANVGVRQARRPVFLNARLAKLRRTDESACPSLRGQSHCELYCQQSEQRGELDDRIRATEEVSLNGSPTCRR